MKEQMKQGFTLIELIIVIAILAFVSVVGIHSYGNIKEIQAKKVNLSNIKRIYHSLATYETLHKEMGSSGYFNCFDSLIDAETSGIWTGTPGQVDFGTYTFTESVVKGVTTQSASFDARQAHNNLGIYDGSWKVLAATYNAVGEGSGAIPEIASAQAQNLGMRTTGLYKSLGIYYLTETDIALLKGAGITTYLLHNPSTAQAYGTSRGGYCTAIQTVNNKTLTAEGLELKGGGPGFRPDMSAFYQAEITNGMPVAVFGPTSSVYTDLGYDLALTNGVPSEAYAKSALAKTKLLAFGIGRSAECVVNQSGLGEAPYNPVYSKSNYRSYIAVFALKYGGQGVASTCRLAGIVDCAGNTYKAADYAVNWTTQLDAD